MNYFELYNIPVSLHLNAADVKKKFYELSRQYHPDFFTNESKDQQADILEMSSLVNKAFKTFSNEDETIKYVLQLKGLLEEEEKYQLPSNFLMDVMDLNEQLMEAKMDGDEVIIASLKSQIKNLKTEIYAPVKEIIEHYKDDLSSEKELLQVKDYYYKKKYLNRILAGIK